MDAVYAIYNEFKNVMVQKLAVEKLLPIDPAVLDEGKSQKGEPSRRRPRPGERVSAAEAITRRPVNLVDYIYEQPVAEIFGGLVPRYLESEVFRILLESAAAEHAARMTAMDSATRNASELIDKLTLADEQDSPGGHHEGTD